MTGLPQPIVLRGHAPYHLKLIRPHISWECFVSIRDFIFGTREKREARSLEKARSAAWLFHHRHMRNDSRWMGFFAPTNGMTLYTFYTNNYGFSRVIVALKERALGLMPGESMSVADIQITCLERGNSKGGHQSLRIRAENGAAANVTLRGPVEDWKTGEREAKHEVSGPGGMRITLGERFKPEGNWTSGHTSPADYGRYVAFFDIFREFVKEVAPRGNVPDSEFQSACHQLVHADGGLPGSICLRDHGLMASQVAARYLANVVETVRDIHSAMVSEGFVYGERKLVHDYVEMFALPPDESGSGSFVLRNRLYSSEPCIFSFETAGRKVSSIEFKEGILAPSPQVTYDVRDQKCRMTDPSVADEELERAMRLLDSAKEVFCGRKIDFESFSAFRIDDDFRGYKILDINHEDEDELERDARMIAGIR